MDISLQPIKKAWEQNQLLITQKVIITYFIREIEWHQSPKSTDDPEVIYSWFGVHDVMV